jgi:hypothetical protein
MSEHWSLALAQAKADPWFTGTPYYQWRADSLNSMWPGAKFTAESIRTAARAIAADPPRDRAGECIAIGGWIGFIPGERRTGGYGPSTKPKKAEAPKRAREKTQEALFG